MKRPHILIFSIAYEPFVGGAEVATRELCKRLSDHRFTLITPWNDRRLPRRERIDDIEVIRVGLGVKAFDKYLLPWTAFRTALKIHKKDPAHALWSIMANTAGLAALFTKWRTKLPFLLTLQEGGTEAYYWKLTWFWRPLYKAIYRQPDHVQTISQFLKKRARRYGYKGPLTVVPNGVDIPHFSRKVSSSTLKSLQRDLGLEAQDRLVITTSRFSYKNGIDDLLKGFYLLHRRWRGGPLKLLLLGDGEQRSQLKTLVGKYHLRKNVLFLGYRPHEELPAYLKLADVFIRPSRSEGLGNSFLEAMVAGLPVVGTRVGGIPDFLAEGKTGIFCRSNDPDSIAEALYGLLTQEPLRQSIAKAGQKAAISGYNWDDLAPQMNSIFDALLSS